MTKEMDIKSMGDDELQNLFEDAFQNTIALKNDIQDFDVSVERNVDGNGLTCEVTVIGLAGTPSIDKFRAGDVEGADMVTIERADKGLMKLALKPEKTTFLSGNDYIIVYENN